MPYSERVIFSAERNGMWYKYRKNQPKEVHCVQDKDQLKIQLPA